MRLASETFIDGGTIPLHHTVQGENLSPPLVWRDPPEGVKSYVLIFEDCNAPHGSRVHWVAYDIPGHHAELTEGAGRPAGFEDYRHAINDFDQLGYSGPSPRHLGAHRYRFRLLALSCAELPIRTHPSGVEVEEAARPYVLATSHISGVFVPERERGARAG